MARMKNINWNLNHSLGDHDTTEKYTAKNEVVTNALLMDIRDELREIRAVLKCHNTTDIPNILRKVEKNTRKKKRARLAAKGGK